VSAISYVASHGASSAGLRAGDVLTARQLLDAMLLPSGCDAAYVLATAYGPGRAAFVAKMNAEARRLGLAKTHFANFDGLPYPTPRATYSTPASLIALGRAAMALAAFRATVGPAGLPPGRPQRAPRVHLAEHQPDARLLRRDRRHQDRVH
jgi:D-alanyl-D-alanine carboxypeptidase (penicillin-binding protein 5/6)